MIKRYRLLIPIIIVGIAVVIAIVLLRDIITDSTPDTLSSNGHAGQYLYQQHCASCHGQNLEGQPNWKIRTADGKFPAPPHDQTGHTWHHDDKTLFLYTKFGGKDFAKQQGIKGMNSGMPAYKDILSDGQIMSILDYIKSTWPQEIRDMQASRNIN